MQEKKDFLIKALYFAVCLAIYYVIFRYVIYIAWPFAIALLIAVLTRRPTMFVSRKLHIPEKGAAAIITLLFYLIFAGIVVLGVIKAVWAIIDWSATWPTLYKETLAPALESVFAWIRSLTDDSENKQYLAQLGATIIERLYSIIGLLSSKAVSFASAFAVGVPKAIVATIFMVVSNFYIAMDYDRISRWFMKQFSPNQQQIIVSSKEYIGVGIIKIIGSYLLLMLITFVELSIAFKIINISSPVLIALVIAIFDLMPVLGTGGVMIPWFIIEFILGNTKLGLELLIIYAIVTVIRNAIEPKIVGDSIGIHPVLMLLSLYLGAIVLGPLGLAILPLTLIIIKKLNDAELIHLFKPLDEEI